MTNKKEKYTGNLVWIDLEMSGLDIRTDVILEIATIITDNALNIVEIGPEFVIHQPDTILDNMNEWCIRTHNASGLTTKVRESKISLQEAERETLFFLEKYAQKDQSPLCGNSVWQDKIFLNQFMPSITKFLSYRIIDVSSIKEVVKRWYLNNKNCEFSKPENHRAMEDIKYSIEELRHYKKYFFLEV